MGADLRMNRNNAPTMTSNFATKTIIILIAIFMPLLTAMGPAGGRPGSIPVPAKKFAAVVTDQQDIVTEIQDVSIEGETFLEGKKGEGTFTVAFENMLAVNFLMNENRLSGQVKLSDGTVVTLGLNGTRKVFGRTPYGTFQITLGDIKKLAISKRGK